MSTGAMGIAGRVALVTGAGHGIGRGIAYALAREGARVVVNWSRDQAAAEHTVRRIAEQGGEALAVRADVGEIDQCRALVQRSQEAFGPIEILVSNAGIGQPHRIVDTPDEEWERVINVNLRATFALARAALPSMIARRYGRVVTISSNIAYTGKGGASFATYGASKAGLIALTKGIAHEGAPYVTANAIVPGGTNRKTADERGEEWPPPPAHDDKFWLGWRVPLNRTGTPEDIAAAVLFFVSDAACFITGQALHVSGGSMMP